MYDVAIVGAGASGMVAAISAKREKPKLKIVLIEALPRIGKKILATGNGRCNLTNYSAKSGVYNSPSVTPLLDKYPPERVVDFFSSIGLECVADSESRVYPSSNMATSVLDCLRFELERLGIEILTETKVTAVRKTNGIFIINSSIRAKRLILSTGGKASPSQGSDGSGYELLRGLNHTVTPLYSGLVQLTVKEDVKQLKGIRAKAEVSLRTVEGKTIDSSSGEVLFTDYGLSGIAIMDISRSVRSRNCECGLNILPDLTTEDVEAFLKRAAERNPLQSLEDALTGLIPKNLGRYIIKHIGFRSDITVGTINNKQRYVFADSLKNLKFVITGTKGFENAQVTVGGADTDEFDMSTLESKMVKGLYCTGELLDVDAPCGGFNLQWAWASGIAAGKSCSRSL